MVTIHPRGKHVMIVRYIPPLLPGVASLGLLLLLWNSTSPSLSDRLTLLSLPAWTESPRQVPAATAFGWRDVPVQDGVAKFYVTPPESLESTAFDDYLLISAFGTPADRTSVRIRAESQKPDDTAAWTPIAPSQILSPADAPAPVAGIETARPARLEESMSSQIGPVESDIGAPRTIEFPRTRGGAWALNAVERVRSEVVWSSGSCRVWRVTDEPFDARSQAWAEQVGRLCTEHVRPAVQNMWGAWPDVDGDGVLNLLITERVAHMGSEVQAYVRQQDFRALGDTAWNQPWDVIYLRPGQDLDQLEAVLKHEVTHVAQFSWCRQLCGSHRWPLPDWLTEGLAHATEIQLAGGTCTTNLEDRLDAFAALPASTPLVVADATASRLWRDPAQRGASAAFCRWWQQHTGIRDWPEIIHGFQQAEQDPWNQLTGRSFAELYRQWTLSVLTEGLPTRQPGKCQFPRSLSLKPGEELTHAITGTATLYVKLGYLKLDEPGAGSKGWNITVECDHGPTVQVTRVRVPRRQLGINSLAAGPNPHAFN